MLFNSQDYNNVMDPNHHHRPWGRQQNPEGNTDGHVTLCLYSKHGWGHTSKTTTTEGLTLAHGGLSIAVLHPYTRLEAWKSKYVWISSLNTNKKKIPNFQNSFLFRDKNTEHYSFLVLRHTHQHREYKSSCLTKCWCVLIVYIQSFGLTIQQSLREKSMTKTEIAAPSPPAPAE